MRCFPIIIRRKNSASARWRGLRGKKKGKIYTIRINEENPKKLCYLRKNFQMEDLLTFILGMAFWLSGIFYLIGEFVFFK
jgi:hypothetical protein